MTTLLSLIIILFIYFLWKLCENLGSDFVAYSALGIVILLYVTVAILVMNAIISIVFGSIK